MKKRFSLARLRYRLDCIMAKGAVSMALLLLLAAVTVVFIIGLLSFLLTGGRAGVHFWVSFMHILDPGTLTADSVDNVLYLVIMSVATVCGLCLTSLLVGIMATGVESKLSELRRGSSVVQEEGHTVIIGFNANVCTLLEELIIANANKKRACVVVLGTEDKQAMEEAITAALPDTCSTQIICRSGSLYEPASLERCAVESCRSVIVNIYEDAETVKILLALSTYLRAHPPLIGDIHFTALIHDRENLEVARIAGDGYAELIYGADAISRIIAHSCRRHGLSAVISGVLDFRGDEFYYESVPGSAGKRFGETVNMVSNAVVLGLKRGERVFLNPPMDTPVKEGDQLALLEQDDGVFRLSGAFETDETAICTDCRRESGGDNILIIGSSDKLPLILEEYDMCVSPGTRVVLFAPKTDLSLLGTDYKNIVPELHGCDISEDMFRARLEAGIDNVLVLGDDSLDPEASDSRVLMHLLMLRSIADRAGKNIGITAEMQNSANEKLAAMARLHKAVAGTAICGPCSCRVRSCVI